MGSNPTAPTAFDEELFRQAVRDNISIAGVVRGLKRAAVGSNYRFVRRHVARLGLNTEHWKGKSHGTSPREKLDPKKVFTENSRHATVNIKRLILRENLLPYVCDECGSGPIWRGKPLVLRLDHENGVRNDHRLQNLRFLCPNCDSQSDTYCGRNK